MSLTELMHWFLSDDGLIGLLAANWPLGIALLAAIIFVETGIVVMPFLPGDSLLFAAGAFLGVAGLSPVVPILVITLAAIAGDATNYAIGRSPLGQIIVTRGWIKPHHMDATRAYFDRYGTMTITVARFVPIVRTIAPFAAGLAGMDVRRFAAYNVIGAVLWCVGVTLAGYWLGRFEWVRTNLHWLAVAIVFVSVLPMVFHAISRPRPRVD
jgi:membrane-associated protein